MAYRTAAAFRHNGDPQMIPLSAQADIPCLGIGYLRYVRR
jgi:hypothetical protein